MEIPELYSASFKVAWFPPDRPVEGNTIYIRPQQDFETGQTDGSEQVINAPAVLAGSGIIATEAVASVDLPQSY